MQPIHEINMPLSFVLLNLGSVERKQKKKKKKKTKTKKLKRIFKKKTNNLNIYLENKSSFLDEINPIFIVSEGLSIGVKIKSNGHKL